MSTSYLDKLNQRYACKAMNGETVPQRRSTVFSKPHVWLPRRADSSPLRSSWSQTPTSKQNSNPQHTTNPKSQIAPTSSSSPHGTPTPKNASTLSSTSCTKSEASTKAQKAYRQNLLASYPQKSAEESFQHASKQAYIALMSAMTQAAFEDVDSTPMEGFIPAEVDSILDLNARGLKSSVLLAVGYKDAEKDWLLPMKKVRKPMDTFVTVLD